jgi:hypothetical protein
MALVGLNLITLQANVAAYIQGDVYFDDIPVLSQRIKDITSAFHQAIANIGIVAVVVTPTAQNIRPNEPSLVADSIPVQIIVAEDVMLNNTGKRALECAQVIAAMLHQQYNSQTEYDNWDDPANAKPTFVLVAAPNTITLLPDDTLLMYSVNMTTMGVWAYDRTAGSKTTEQIFAEAGIPLEPTIQTETTGL